MPTISSGRILLAVAASWALAGGPAAQSAAGATAQDPAGLVEEAGLRLFGIDDPAEVVEYFQGHRVAVAYVTEPVPDRAGEWSVSLVYPSLNFGGAGEGFGPTVIYPHDAVVTIPDGVVQALDGIDTREHLLVLEVSDGGDFRYELVGTAIRRPRDSAVMNWFADKLPLVYRFRRPSG